MILVLADDMTGALEVGAVFAASGFDTAVCTKVDPRRNPEVLILDTETRHISETAAFDAILATTRAVTTRLYLVYKKTDSTLRGNIRSELAALARAFPMWSIGYAPAYPGQGRIVKDGLVFVDGVPVAESNFGLDALNPVMTSSVRELIGGDLRCEIFDGSNDEDVRNAAKIILADDSMRIAAGPTALAAVLAKELKTRATTVNALPIVHRCLVLNGSRTAVSRSQLYTAEQDGCISEDAPAAWAIVNPWIAPGSDAATVASARAGHLIESLRQSRADAVFIIGGDTAYAFVSALDHPSIQPIGEALPGVAVSRLNASEIRRHLPSYGHGLTLITKAGGFGDKDVLCQVRQILEQNAR